MIREDWGAVKKNRREKVRMGAGGGEKISKITQANEVGDQEQKSRGQHKENSGRIIPENEVVERALFKGEA